MIGTGPSKNYFVQEQLDYTTSPATRSGWKMRYEFALTYIEKNDVILDCACGLGENTQMMAQRCRKAIGLDIDNYFIAHNEAKWPEVEFHCADVTHTLPFPDDHFDMVVSIETLEHLPTMSSVRAALTNFHRVMKPGGMIIASGPNREAAGNVPLVVLTKLWLRRLLGPYGKQQATWHGHYRHWTPEAFRRLFLPYFEKVSLFGQHPNGIKEDLSQASYLILVAQKLEYNELCNILQPGSKLLF